MIRRVRNLVRPLFVSLVAAFAIAGASLTFAQSPDSEAKRLDLDGCRAMLEFFSTGDTAKFDEAISLWNKSKAEYNKVSEQLAKDSNPAAQNMKWLVDVMRRGVELKLSEYTDYIKTHTAKEAPATRTRKIKAEGKEYLVSKDNKSMAESLAKDLKPQK